MYSKAPIAWHHGQFLQPQHFQMADQYQHSIIANLLPIAQRYFWGFSQLSIDTAALDRGQLVINEAQLFWQDGSYIDLAQNAVVGHRLLPPDLFLEDNTAEIYIGLKRLDEAKPNASRAIDDKFADIKTRYVIDDNHASVADLYQDGPEATVGQLKYVLKLFFQHELCEIQGYDLLPLLKITKAKNSIELVSDYSPSLTQLGAWPLFWQLLAEQRTLLISAFNFALAYKPNQEWYQLHVGELGLGKYLLAQALHRLIPAIIELLDQKATHPFSLYQKMRETIHELSFYLSSKINNDDYGYLYQFVDDYDHQKPYLSLLNVSDRLSQILLQILNGPQFRIVLKANGSHYDGDLPSQFLSGNNHFYLIVQGKRTQTREFMDHLTTAAKLTSKLAIDDYIKHAIPGVPLNYLPSRPSGAPDIVGAVYFEVDCKHPEWAKIVQQANASFYPGNIDEPLHVELVSARGA